MKYGSLFSGVGGFDMGFDNAGYDCQWQVEWDKHCQQTLAYHWHNVPRYGDVQTVSGHNLEPVDVIIYGSPCQDLSVAGRRAGLDGSKSSMFFESVRIFKEMRDATGGIFPRVVVWENVPGALNSNQGRDFHAVLTALDDIGAVAQWWNVLDAQFFGVPQRRRRVFLVSVFDPAIAGRAGTKPVLAVGKGRRRNTSKGRPQRQGFADDAQGSVDVAGSAEPALPLIADYEGARDGQLVPITEQHLSFDTQFGSNANVFEDLAPTLKASQQSPSVTSGTIVRRLTPIECERLMGWPDNHTLHRADGKTNSNSTRYKMCGNGVATPVAQWIAEQLKGIM